MDESDFTDEEVGELKVDMANEVIAVAERFDGMVGLDSKDCVEAIEVAAKKLKENGWDEP